MNYGDIALNARNSVHLPSRCQFRKIVDRHVAVGEVRDDLQLPAHRLDEAPQIADVNVGPSLQLGDRRLAE